MSSENEVKIGNITFGGINIWKVLKCMRLDGAAWNKKVEKFSILI